MNSTTDTSSTGGSVLGSATIVVTPPAAAACPPLYDRLHVLGAGLAQLHPHVDEPGREAQPREIDYFNVVAEALAKLSAERRDPVALDQEIARRVEPARRIEEAGVAVEAARGGHAGSPPEPSYRWGLPGHSRLSVSVVPRGG